MANAEVSFPDLTAGAVDRILDGEDVTEFVVQLIGYRKVPRAPKGRCRLLMSDGVTGCPFTIHGDKLEEMAARKELEEFTLLKVHKCICNHKPADRKVVILLRITILHPGKEVKKKLGDPVFSSSASLSTRATTNAATGNSVAKTGDSTINAGAAPDSSVIKGSTQSILFSKLTSGAIKRILDGEGAMLNAVVQLLGCKRIPGVGGDRYRLLISDGASGYPFVMLGTQLNHMVLNKELEKFTILRVDKYACNQFQSDRKVIVLMRLTVLVPGNEVNEVLGKPVNSSPVGASTGTATNVSAKKSVAKKGCSKTNAASACDVTAISRSVQSMMLMMFPQLTNGAINRIRNGEEVPNAVMQILGYEKIPGSVVDRYRFLISDGVTGCPYVLLGTPLNHMVVNKELEEFTIVIVKKCICEEISNHKIIVLLKLTVLNPGNEVNEKLGKPAIASKAAATNAPTENAAAKTCDSTISAGAATDAPTENAAAKTCDSTISAGAADASSVIKESTQSVKLPELSNGAISRILDGEDVENVVLHLISCKKDSGHDFYRLLIFDGLTAWPFSKLSTQLNHMVESQEFAKGPIVRVEKCVCNQAPGSPMEIELLSLTVLVSGNDVNEKLSYPVNSSYFGPCLEPVNS